MFRHQSHVGTTLPTPSDMHGAVIQIETSRPPVHCSKGSHHHNLPDGHKLPQAMRIGQHVTPSRIGPTSPQT